MSDEPSGSGQVMARLFVLGVAVALAGAAAVATSLLLAIGVVAPGVVLALRDLGFGLLLAGAVLALVGSLVNWFVAARRPA